jgi:DnaJ-class molecular chaperone
MSSEVECPVCDGQGWYLADYKDAYRGRVKIEKYCEQCIGLGRVHPSLIWAKNRKKAK